MLTDTATKVAFDSLGDGGPAVLFLPGWCGDRTVFADVLPLVGRHRQSVSLDWRGHGGSGSPTQDFGLAELVEDAISVIDESGAERVVPAAAAHAGWAAIELRRRLGPERVPGMVLLDWMVLGAPPQFGPALEAMRDPSRRGAAVTGLTAMWLQGVDSPAVHRYVDDMRASAPEMWSRAAREISASFAEQPTPLAALAELGTPTLHVFAQPHDQAFLEAQQSYAAEHPWFAVRRVEGASHFPTLENAEESAAEIERFVAGLG